MVLNSPNDPTPCSLKLCPSSLTTKSHSDTVLSELLQSCSFEKVNPTSILDQVIPIDEKFSNHCQQDFILSAIKDPSAQNIKVENFFAGNFDDVQEELTCNQFTSQKFDPLTGIPIDLYTEPLEENDERLNIIENSTQSSANSTSSG